jgi:hypothetical protein
MSGVFAHLGYVFGSRKRCIIVYRADSGIKVTDIKITFTHYKCLTPSLPCIDTIPIINCDNFVHKVKVGLSQLCSCVKYDE